MLGISTCWWKNTSLKGDEILRDILALGFEGVELEYRITEEVYCQMMPLLGKELPVTSIHNYFPKPMERSRENASGDIFLLSSTDGDERSRAVRYSIRTIEEAHKLGARAVILHLGRVEMPSPKDRIRALYESGKIKGPEGKRFIDEQKAIRSSRSGQHLDAVLFSLEKLNREAEKRGIFIGIENRYHLHEIPGFDEIGVILRQFRGGRVRYWHDVGHAAAQEAMGLQRQTDLLGAYSDKMAGIHVHDIKGLDDHFSPGQGEVDYDAIKPFFNPSLIPVLEIHPKVARSELTAGARLFREKMGL